MVSGLQLVAYEIDHGTRLYGYEVLTASGLLRQIAHGSASSFEAAKTAAEKAVALVIP